MRRWLQDINLTADLDHAGDLLKTSGGWPAVLELFSKSKKRASTIVQTRIDDIGRKVLKDAGTWTRQRFGLSEEAERVLRELARADDPFDRDSIELVAGEIGVDDAALQQRVEWSERLGFLSRAGEGCWSFNPLLKRLLEAGSPP